MAARIALKEGVRNLLHSEVWGRSALILASVVALFLQPSSNETFTSRLQRETASRDLQQPAKSKLSLLVVSTTAAGYVAAAETASTFDSSLTCLGTFGRSAAATPNR
jgi:heme O synthase-like polyprenyltransferase